MSLQPDHLDKALALSVTSCVTLGKLLDLSEPQFPHLRNGVIVVPAFTGTMRMKRVTCEVLGSELGPVDAR